MDYGLTDLQIHGLAPEAFYSWNAVFFRYEVNVILNTLEVHCSPHLSMIELACEVEPCFSKSGTARLASNPDFPFQILPCSYGETSGRKAWFCRL